MKTITKMLSTVAVAGAMMSTVVGQTPAPTPAPAPDAKKMAPDTKQVADLKKKLEDAGVSVNYVETQQKGITLSGYVDTSYTYQFASGNYGPNGISGVTNVNQKNLLRAYDNYNNNFNVDAVKIALQKSLSDKDEFTAGFRIDTIYGSDAKFITDKTFDTNSLALEQAYVNFRVPVGNGLDFKLGKFVALTGYEVIESPANPNFSRGLLFQNAIPSTHTGLLGAYKVNDAFDFQFGIVDGWNNSQSTSPQEIGLGQKTGFGKCFTGQVALHAPGKNADLYQSFVYSPEGEPGVNAINGASGDVVVYDIYGNWKPLFLKDQNWTLGFNVDLGYDGNSGVNQAAISSGSTLTSTTGAFGPGAYGTTNINALESSSNTWYGVALYSIYQFKSDDWKWLTLAGRGEYLHCSGAYIPKYGGAGFTATGAPIFNSNGSGIVPYSSQDDYSYTATASFAIWDNLLTRVEYRFDLLHGATTSLPGSANEQHEITLNAVYSF